MEKFGLLALSGGGGGLPPVSSADNGKVLAVEDGAWAASEQDFVVTFSYDGVDQEWSANKTFFEVKAAYDAKKRVYGKMSAADVTSDPAFSSFTLLIPLSGIYGSAPLFSGTYQGQTKTLFVSFSVGLSAVTAYIKEIELAPAPLVVTYTITGQPVGNVYPMSSNTEYSDIQTALAAGREVKALASVGGGDGMLPVVFKGSTYVTYAINAIIGGQLTVLSITQTSTDSYAKMIPVNTAQMLYDPSTNALAMTNVPEVSS